jgi:hypothetical protein
MLLPIAAGCAGDPPEAHRQADAADSRRRAVSHDSARHPRPIRRGGTRDAGAPQAGGRRRVACLAPRRPSRFRRKAQHVPATTRYPQRARSRGGPREARRQWRLPSWARALRRTPTRSAPALSSRSRRARSRPSSTACRLVTLRSRGLSPARGRPTLHERPRARSRIGGNRSTSTPRRGPRRRRRQ